MNMTFSILLKKYRERSRLSVSDVSNRVVVSSGYIRNLESGKQKTPPTLEKCQILSDIFDLSAQEKFDFFKSAFKGRLGDDLPFYETLEHMRLPEAKRTDILQDPLVSRCISLANKQPQDIVDGVKTLLDDYIRLPPEKRQAILSLCK